MSSRSRSGPSGRSGPSRSSRTSTSRHPPKPVLRAVSDEAPPAPEHLSERSRAFWAEVAGDWLLETPHLELLRRCCEAMDVADAAAAERAGQLTVVDRFGQTKLHPLVAVERDARAQVASLLKDLRLEVVE